MVTVIVGLYWLTNVFTTLIQTTIPTPTFHNPNLHDNPNDNPNPNPFTSLIPPQIQPEIFPTLMPTLILKFDNPIAN